MSTHRCKIKMSALINPQQCTNTNKNESGTEKD